MEPTSAATIQKPVLPRIASTKSWFLYIGDGFSIRVPPSFDDVTEPEVCGNYVYGEFFL